MTSLLLFFFFFNDTATTEIYTLSLHDALPISRRSISTGSYAICFSASTIRTRAQYGQREIGEHTSELQSPCNLVCRLLLEKKKYLSLCLVSTSLILTSLVCSTGLLTLTLCSRS